VPFVAELLAEIAAIDPAAAAEQRMSVWLVRRLSAKQPTEVFSARDVGHRCLRTCSVAITGLHSSSQTMSAASCSLTLSAFSTSRPTISITCPQSSSVSVLPTGASGVGSEVRTVVQMQHAD
jgi:hypothetical protein